MLATGGMGQVFSSTTNPSVSTGDGVALALRAGAEVTDLEFVQFHPTALWLGPPATGPAAADQRGRARRGRLPRRRRRGRVITAADHPLADLAPRDVVAKAITRRMPRSAPTTSSSTPAASPAIEARFPTIVARCREAGIDPVADLIPVAPAAHYASGGVRTDLDGRTSVPGLYACGEVACTGVHGANRLASNSLLEGLVFAGRIGADLERGLPEQGVVARQGRDAVLLDPSTRPELARTMTEGSGVLRSADSLVGAAKALLALEDRVSTSPSPAAWEATGLHAVATALVAAAARREETRGAHWREDFPVAGDAWRGHLVTTLAGHRLTDRWEEDPMTLSGPRRSRRWRRPASTPARSRPWPSACDRGGPGRRASTSRASRPCRPTCLGTAAFVPRAAVGVVAGIPVAMACIDVVGDEHVGPRPDRRPGCPRRDPCSRSPGRCARC